MTSDETRRSFLNYFAERGHRIVPSASLVPKDDPTLLFTNAGMVQFKGVFLTEETRDYIRATTSQKCVRAGGKHNDLENVGITARHHTFFEMLGNFSFGDYFKEEAIEMGWDLLIHQWGLPREKMWITIYLEDDEAFHLWRKIGIPEDRIVRLGEKDNFWAMGETGPCGPCSEIIIDQGEGIGCGRPSCSVACDCDRFLELWNLVFMQFNRDQEGKLHPLAKPCIDTGMGLERISAILQGVRSNYDTNLFKPLIQEVEAISGTSYGKDPRADISIRVIADHSRATTFLISDGVLPSNEGRGYVLRRIMRRAIRHGKMLGIRDSFLDRTSSKVVELMRGAYPELMETQSFTSKVIRNEEERFSETLDSGLKILREELERLKEEGEKTLSGEVVFRLYDTYGFPPDLTDEILREEGLGYDEIGFQAQMEGQRQKSKQSWQGIGEGKTKEVYRRLANEGVRTAFTGYEEVQSESKILKLVRGDEIVSSAGEGEEIEVITEKTPFYGEAGGQVGDRGVIFQENYSLEVVETLKPAEELIVHQVRVKRGMLKEGMEASLRVDPIRRRAIALNHTATHLLQAVLKEVLGDHIRQAGSLVSAERLRFDFTHFAAIEKEDLARIEALVNQKIRENLKVDTKAMAIEEALQMGAMALFGEKYGEKVRVVMASDFSMELCGGTHTSRTGDIGLFKILNEMGVAAGVRRIEALTGEAADEHVREEERELWQTAQALKAHPGEIFQKVDRLLQRQRELEREILSLQGKLGYQEVLDLLSRIKEVKGIKLLSAKIDGKDPKQMREYIDQLKAKIGSGIVLLGGQSQNKVSLIIGVTPDLTRRYNASELIKKISVHIGGTGGGRPDFAQAGGTNSCRLDEALKAIEDLI
ncbi:MAG: alanine--tRNA ligase [Deltaproteobacteria bacterium RBG_16_48_10]|nr:MAG: alanine--tRNA ligase [Deltaproteobacteria bacterium RBG_16_48_10]